MNRSELRNTTRSLLNEDSPGFWTDSQLNSYINLSMQRVNSIISALREDYFTVSATFITTSGTKSYIFPTDCRFIRRLEIYDPADTGVIKKIDPLRWPRTEASGEWPFTEPGEPSRFIVLGNQFDLYPIPDNAYNMRIYYDARKTDLASETDSPATPEDFHDMIVYWACLLAKKQNEEDDTGFVSLFNSRKSELIETLINRSGEDPHVVEAYLEGIL